MKYGLWLISCLLVALSAEARPIPKLSGPVVDEAQLFKQPQILEATIRRLHAEGQAQITILTINSLEGAVLESYSMAVAEAWQLGDRKLDNGLLILIAVQDRKIRLEVGQGLEGDITDAFANRIISQMKPKMKRQDYDAAAIVALEAIEKQIAYNSPAARAERERLQQLHKSQAEAETRRRAAQWQQLTTTLEAHLYIPVLLLALGFGFYALNYLSIKPLLAERPQLTKTQADVRDQHFKLTTQKNQQSIGSAQMQYHQAQQELHRLQDQETELAQKLSAMKRFIQEHS